MKRAIIILTLAILGVAAPNAVFAQNAASVMLDLNKYSSLFGFDKGKIKYFNFSMARSSSNF